MQHELENIAGCTGHHCSAVGFPTGFSSISDSRRALERKEKLVKETSASLKDANAANW
ncbi:hypothetical protein [Chromobacterium sphagni]|uniref:hypothetical protein n=1 Tax=Chromobacterium sphagni TaxID=1903179 RepID=UPI0013014C95|nr:hypothetical protein [Chromobacterium sphagni]